jgi:hypothetical protein
MVSRQFATAAAGVRTKVRSCGICGGKNDTGPAFLPVKKNGTFWEVTPCGSCKNRCFRQAFLRSVRRLLVTDTVVPSSSILVTLMKEALGSSETSVLTRTTRRNIPEDTILHSHRRENLKSYIFPSTSVSPVNSHCIKQTPWSLVHKQTIPTERPPLVDEI